MLRISRQQPAHRMPRKNSRRDRQSRGALGLTIERVEPRLAMTGGFGDVLLPQGSAPPAVAPAAVVWAPPASGGQTGAGLPSSPALPAPSGADLIAEIKAEITWDKGVSCVGAYPPVTPPAVQRSGLPGAIDTIDPNHVLPQAKLEKLLEQVDGAIQDTWVFPLWPGHCQRWVNEFETNLPPEVSMNPLIKNLRMMWEPSICIGGGHAFYEIELRNGTVIKIDNGAGTGLDHYDVTPPRLP